MTPLSAVQLFIFLSMLDGIAGFSSCGRSYCLSRLDRRYRLQTAVPATTEADTVVAEESKATLKVPSSAWRWPPAWPFPDNYLEYLPSDKPPIHRDTDVDRRIINHIANYTTEADQVLFIGDTASLQAAADNYPYQALHSASFSSIVANDNILPFGSNEFDKVILISGVENLDSPTDFFREVWRVMKPTGQCFNCFYGTPRLPADIPSVSMWETMNDEQKIWIAGAYYHYSAVGGWEQIEGYDIAGNTASGTLNFKQANQTDVSAYVVQSQKVDISSFNSTGSNDLEITAEIFRKLLLSRRHLSADDRKFLSYRLATKIVKSSTIEEMDSIIAYMDKLSSIYNVLKDVKEVVVPSPVKALLSMLMIDKWTGSSEEEVALRMSLGVTPPNAEFWVPVSSATMELRPKEKIYFIADLVPLFNKLGEGEVLSELPNLLTKGLEILTSRFEKVEASQLQLFLTDVVVSDYLNSPKPDVGKIIKFLTTISLNQLEKVIQEINDT